MQYFYFSVNFFNFKVELISQKKKGEKKGEGKGQMMISVKKKKNKKMRKERIRDRGIIC